ncbi:MAG: ABC transporter permease [Candidatus Heimdallarchaeota archaeon]|nr:ABC transporter permease [Candidatus Heimdallarchaeota archaeon]
MMTKLIVLYFFFNRKRTYRAIIILAIGLTIILATNMLIAGFISEVQYFTNSYNRENVEFEIVNSEYEFNDIPHSTLNEIERILEDSDDVIYHYSGLALTTKLYMEFSEANYRLDIIDIDQLSELGILLLPTNIIFDIPYVNNNLGLISVDSENYFTIDLDNTNISFSDPIEFHSSYPFDFVIDVKSDFIPSELIERTNYFKFKLSDDADSDAIFNKLKDVPSIEIRMNENDVLYLQQVAIQISYILNIFQVSLSIILSISISYVILSVVYDSERDLHIMKSIGLHNRSLMILIFGQTLLIGLFAFIWSISISLVMVYLVISLMASTSLFPYFVIELLPSFLISTFLQSSIVSILASIYPTIKVIK